MEPPAARTKILNTTNILLVLTIAFFILFFVNLKRTKYASYFLGMIIPLILEAGLLYYGLYRASVQQKAKLDYEFAVNQIKAWLELKSAPDAYLKANPPPPKRPKPLFFENSFTETHAQVLHEFRNAQDASIKEVVETALPPQDLDLNSPRGEIKSSFPVPTSSQKNAPSRERSPTSKPATAEPETTIQSSKKTGIDKTPSKALAEEKVKFRSLYHKNFVAQINAFLDVLRTISNSDKHYGKGLKGLGVGSTSIFSQEEGLFDYNQHENSYIASTDLSVKEKALFVKKFGEPLVKKQKIILPAWRVIRNTINAVGNIQLECSNSIEKATIDLVVGLNQQYSEGYLEAKRSRKRYKEEYERRYTNYTKTISDYETAQKNLEAALADYQNLVKKKDEKKDESTPALLKLEIKARLLKQEIDSIKNKLADAKDQVDDARLKANEENERIKAFVSSWNEQREDVFRHTMRTVISVMEENLADVDLSFENLISSVNELISTPEKKPEERKLEEEKKEEAPLEQESLKDELLEEDTSTQNPGERQDTLASMGDIGSEFTSRSDLDSKARKYTTSAEIKRKNDTDKRSMTMMVSNKQKTVETGHTSKTTDDIFKIPPQIPKYSSDHIKYVIETATQKLTTYQTSLAEKLKTGKKIESIFKLLITIEEQYQNESSVLCNSNFLNLDNSELGKIWKLFKHNFFLSNRIRLSLIEKLVLSHRELLDFLKIIERETKHCESVYNQALKRLTIMLTSLKKGPVAETIADQEAEHFRRDITTGDRSYVDTISKMEETYSKIKKKLIYLYLDLNDASKERLNALISEADILTIRSEKKLSGASPDEKEIVTEIRPKVPKLFTIEDSTEKEGSVSNDPAAEAKHRMKKTLLKELKDLENEYIHSFKVLDFAVEPHSPKIEKMISLPCDKYEFLYELDADYTGTIMMELEAKFCWDKNKKNSTPLHGKLAIKSLKGTLRVCFVPSEYGASWLCFTEEPKISYHIDLEYGSRKKFFEHIPQVSVLVEQLLSNVFQEIIYPERVEVDIPMAIAKIKEPHEERKVEHEDKTEAPKA